MRRANTCRMIVALATFAAATSVASGRDILSDDFNDGDLNGWTASGAGTWSADNVSYSKTAHHVATGTAGRIEHSLDLSGDTWSVEYEAGWQWGSGNAGLILSVWLLDDQDNGYQAQVIQDGRLFLRRVDRGTVTDLAGPFSIGKLAGDGPLTSFRVTRSTAGVLAFDFSPGDRWFNALAAIDTTHGAITRIRLQEDTGKGNAIFDNIVVADTPSPKKPRKATAAEHQALRPADVDRFYVEPNEPTELTFCLVKAPSSFFSGSISYYITDYRDHYVSGGRASWSCGVIHLPVTLKQGYYILRFPSAGQSFGIHAIPAAESEPDLFFGIDSSMSWFIKPERNLRENLARVLERNGIHSARGRVAWSGIEPKKEKWVWDGDCQYETLRELYVRHGIQLLDMCEVTPKWNDPDGGGGVHSFLQDLAQTVRSWQTISRRWKDLWAGFEIWNEPDNNSFFNGGTHEDRGVPADQYTQFAKAISYAFHKAGVKTPLIGGCFSISVLGADFSTTPSAYHRLAARNGLLDYVDGVSFHSYSPPPEIQGQVTGMRGWLAENGKPSMPVYLTESGVVPWSDGRTPLTQTAGLAMKMIEAKVCVPLAPRYSRQSQPHTATNEGIMNRSRRMSRLLLPASLLLTAVCIVPDIAASVDASSPQAPASIVCGRGASSTQQLAARDKKGVWVRLHFDCDREYVRVRSTRGEDARLSVEVPGEEDLFVRVPGWTPADSAKLLVGGKPAPFRRQGAYVVVPGSPDGLQVELRYALPRRTTTETSRMQYFHTPAHLFGPAAKPYVYTLQWRGDEVVAALPVRDYFPLYPAHR